MGERRRDFRSRDLRFTYLAFIVAFFAAVMAGKRHTVWLVIALQFACSIWFVPLAYGQAVLP